MVFPSGWAYCKSCSVTGSGGAGTNYVIGIKCYKGAGTDGTEVVNGITMGKVYLPTAHVRDDFGDVRFSVSLSGVELSFWQDPNLLVSGTSSVFWVKVSSDLGSDQTIYIYYGNSGQTTDSNGNNTFLLFDDFTGATLDGAKWNTDVHGSGTVTVDSSSNCILTVHPASTIDAAAIESIATFTHEVAVVIRKKYTNNPSSGVAYSSVALGSGAATLENSNTDYFLKSGYRCRYYNNSSANSDPLSKFDAAGTETALDQTLYSLTYNTYQIHELRYYGATGIFKNIVDGSIVQSSADTIYYSNNKKILISAGSYNSGNYGSSWNIDYVFVRPFNSSGTEPAPSGTWGSEIGLVALSGVTRDSSGNILGSCTVLLYLASDYSYKGTVTSDASTGVYTFYVNPGTNYFVVARKSGSPDVMGITDNNIQGS